MNRPFLILVLLLLLLQVKTGTAQEGEKLTCQVKNATYKIRQTNGAWSDWRDYNKGTEKKETNIIFDFAKMNMFWVSQGNLGNQSIDPGITMYKIVSLTQDTSHKQFGFYNIKLQCHDAKGIATEYELLSLATNSCHSLLLVSADDRFITKRELEIVR